MNRQNSDTGKAGLQRDPDEWKTGDEPMIEAQRSYLETLCRETGEEVDDTPRTTRLRSSVSRPVQTRWR
jgi:hypothetical protein